MFSEGDPYDYLDEEGRPARVLPGIDGGKAEVHGNFNPWAFFETLTGIASRRFGAEVTVTDVIRKADGSHVPRPSERKFKEN